MKTSQLFQLIFGIAINCCILGVIIFIVSTKLNFTLEDTIFTVGSIALFIGICSNILGNQSRLLTQYSEDLNSQCASRVDLENHKHENTKDKSVFSAASIISGVIIISSIVILIVGHFFIKA